MEGHDKRYIIPVYQRNYDWGKEHCQKLFDDIIELHQDPKSHPDYFIGSIVSIYDGGDERIIIDGQQRLTTVTLILLAIHNLLESSELKSRNENLAAIIRDNYLENKYQPEDKRIRLKPIQEDNEAFLKLFDFDPTIYDQHSNITQNYLYLFKRILNEAKMGTDPEDIYNAIKRLMIVDIDLSPKTDNPQAIFESINSTGKQLSEADLVRNFILMNQNAREQERLYKKYWYPIEQNTRQAKNSTADFLRDWLTLRQKKYPNINNVYNTFKKLVHSQGEDYELDNLLGELLNYSRAYYQFTSGDIQAPKLRNSISRLRKLGQGVFNPFLLEVFELCRIDEISTDDLVTIVDIMETYAMRRLICSKPTFGLNKFIPTLPSKIRSQLKRQKKADVDYVSVFKYYILNGTGSNSFPTDEEFLVSLTTRDIYNLKPMNRSHFFQRLENHNSKEKIDLEKPINEENYLSIEHIMPQKLNNAWKEELGSDFKLIHEEYLNRLGNLTLTFYNPEMSNRSYQDKKTMKFGYDSSKLWLNKYLQKQSHWGETQMKERAEILAKRANALWDFPKTDFEPASPEEEPISFFENFDFTNRVPSEFYFLDNEFEVDSWRDILRTCLDEMYLNDREAFTKAARDEFYLSLGHADELRRAEELRPGIYFQVNLSAQAISAMIQRLSDALDYEEDDIMVLLLPPNGDGA